MSQAVSSTLGLRVGDLIDFVALLSERGMVLHGDGIRFRQVHPGEDGKWFLKESPGSKIYPGTYDDPYGLVVDFVEEEGNWIILLGTKYLKIANGFAELYLVKNRITYD